MAQDALELVAALRRSHDHLMAIIDRLTDDQVTGRSYCRDWTVAQVLSHLGSGAEMTTGWLDATLAGRPLPGQEASQAIWARWNAKTPQQQRDDCRTADTAAVERYESLSDEQLSSLRIPLFGREFDAAGMLRLRLGEHAIHTWDVEVIADRSALVLADAVGLLVDNLGLLAARTGKPPASPLDLRVVTEAPERRLRLTSGEAVQLGPADRDGDGGELRLPAEALVRLVYGRLDPEHTPEVQLSGTEISLDDLRLVFPGF